MRLNEYLCKHYIVLSKTEDADICSMLSLWDSKEHWDKSNDDGEIPVFEGYVCISDAELEDHPDYENWFGVLK